MEMVVQVFDHISTSFSHVVDNPIGQKIDQQLKIVDQWIDEPENQLRVGRMGSQVEHPCRDD
jgi:hypothetical protein